MQEWKATQLHPDRLLLGEGAAWHAGWKKFLYVDIEGRRAGTIDSQTGIAVTVPVKKRVSAVLPASGNRLLVAMQGSLGLLDMDTGMVEDLVAVEPDRPHNRCNDGKCDAMGRLWLGTMHVNAEKGAGALYRYDGGLMIKMIGDRSVSNGLGWSPDNRTMYYIDSFDYNIKAYDFDVRSGAITHERVIVDIKIPEQLPDGMCVDAAGMLWVAIWGGGAVHRYDPATGALTGRVIVDAPHVSNCAFGGKDMQQLFITTAKDGLTEAQLEQYPLSGSLFIVDTGIRGLEGFAFNGI